MRRLISNGEPFPAGLASVIAPSLKNEIQLRDCRPNLHLVTVEIIGTLCMPNSSYKARPPNIGRASPRLPESACHLIVLSRSVVSRCPMRCAPPSPSSPASGRPPSRLRASRSASPPVSIGAGSCVASFPCDRASTQFKLGGAWNFADAWDVQLAYFRAGSYRGGDPIPSACSTRSPPHRLTDRAMRNHEQSPRLKSAACSA